jgi:hypothetical protein
LFLHMIGNRFLKIGSKSTSVIGEPIIGVAAIGTGESAPGSAITLPCAMGVTAAGAEKNGSATIGVGTQTRFSLSRISLHDLDVSIRTVETEPLRIIWIANEMTTYSLRVQLPNT